MKLHKPGERITDPEEALEMLKDGNDRFRYDQLSDKSTYAEDRAVLSSGQTPFAVIITCSDSRVAPEIYFDAKLGSLFVIRNAGNIVDKTTLGSIEYAVEHLGSKLVVVVGHSACGAVTAACAGGELPENIQHVIDHIKPAVAEDGDVDASIVTNVLNMVDVVAAEHFMHENDAVVVGACYDISSGVVNWL